MKTAIAMVLALALTGCVLPQPAPMTPEERLIAIEQQRANTEQIEAGLRMMRTGQPSLPTTCITRQVGQTLQTTCN